MKIICRKCFQFFEYGGDTDETGTKKVLNRLIVQPCLRPTEVPEWIREDITFKAAEAAEDIEVIS